MAAKKKAAKKTAKKAAKKAAKKPVRKAAKKAAKKAKRKPNAAFMRALTPSPALAAVVGAKPLPRTEVVRGLWTYIKKKGLQDKLNKRMINTDDALKAIFGRKDQVSMFDLAKGVGKHLS